MKIPEITRREVLKSGLAAMAGLALLPGELRSAEGKPPNIVLIVLDALRASTLPMYGNQRNTAPFMEQLTKRAALFERCYSTTTWTKPAVASLLTGVPPQMHQVFTEKRALPLGMASFPKALRKQGYRTAFINSNPFLSEGFGADEHFDYLSHAAAKERDYGLRVSFEAEQWLKSLSGEPVLAYLHFMPPHGPYNPPSEYVDRMRRQGRPSDEFLRAEQHDVDISLSNHGLGRIPWYQAGLGWSNDPLFYLTLYEAHTLFGTLFGDFLVSDFFNRWYRLRKGERTIFIISSDHGEGLGDHGLFCDHGKFLADPLLRIPLIVFDTARPEGRIVKEVVSHLDFASSIARLGGSAEEIGTQPRSIFPRGERIEGKKYTALHQEVGAAAEDGWALTEGKWRLVYNDCPHYGNTNVLEVGSATRTCTRDARVPFLVPKTALRHPRTLATGVVLERLALHTAFAQQGKPYPFSGELRLAEGRKGTLHLRALRAGMEAEEIGAFPCSEGVANLEGCFPLIQSGMPNHEGAVHVEARWTTESAGSTGAEGETWKRLFSFPLCSAKAL
ncbi:MAG: sulfatase, partial [Planctomycetota bacterium]